MPEEHVPPVVAVVVTAGAGAWLEQCLESLEQQDYPSLDVLVIETGAADGVTSRVAGVMPSAFVRCRPEAACYGQAANDVLEGIEGASFFLFCHEDVALEPQAVRLMVEEAFRSNAGIVGPKLVDFEAPEHLLQLGLGVTRFGLAVPRVQAGELDQSQHDEVREVFAVPSACFLSRVDLFAALRGFDAEMSELGAGVDLCWRAQLAGARVVTAPRAIVRHRAAEPPPPSGGEELVLGRRSELRAVLKNYGLVRRWVTAAQLLALTLLDSATAPLTGRRERARAARAAWRWNLARRRSLVEARAAVHALRQVSDRSVAARMSTRGLQRRLPSPGLRGVGSGLRRPGAPWRAGAAGTASPSRPAERHGEVDRLAEWLVRAQHGEVPAGQLVAGVVIGLLLVFGTRGLLFGQLPVIGDLVGGPSALHLVGRWLAGRRTGWGGTQAGPPAYGLIGLAGTVLGNSSALALKLVYVSGPALGTIGTWRLVRDFGSSRARIVAAVAFAGSPLLWNVLARGDLEASVALAGLPFVFGRLARSSGLRPFVPAHGLAKSLWHPRDLAAEIAPLGLLLAVMGALAPATVLDVGVLVVTGLAASAVVGGARAMLRSAAIGAGGVLVAFLSCLPWSLAWLAPGARWSLLAGSVPPPGSGPSVADLLRGHTGPVGGWWGAGGLVVLAAAGLVWARGPRLAWATRWWACALVSVLLAWLGSAGWLGAGGGATEVLVAPAAVALAASCGIAAAAFELDVRRHRFGWRQVTAVLAAACFAVGLAPAVGELFGGRAGLPGVGYEETSSELSTASSTGSRSIWLGDPRALPGSSFQLAAGLAAFVTTGGLPTMATLWAPPEPGPAAGVAAEVSSAIAGRTLRLGALLAPAGIRYVVVPTALAPVLPGEQVPPAAPAPGALVAALESQTDLRQLPPEGGVLVFANTAWAPGDGTGTLAGGSSSTAVRVIGTSVALVVLLGCVAEGVGRRRRSGSRRRASGRSQPQGAPPGEAPAEAGERPGEGETSPVAATPATAEESLPGAGAPCGEPLVAASGAAGEGSVER